VESLKWEIRGANKRHEQQAQKLVGLVEDLRDLRASVARTTQALVLARTTAAGDRLTVPAGGRSATSPDLTISAAGVLSRPRGGGSSQYDLSGPPCRPAGDDDHS